LVTTALLGRHFAIIFAMSRHMPAFMPPLHEYYVNFTPFCRHLHILRRRCHIYLAPHIIITTARHISATTRDAAMVELTSRYATLFHIRLPVIIVTLSRHGCYTAITLRAICFYARKANRIDAAAA